MNSRKFILGALVASVMFISNFSLANNGNGEGEIVVKQYTWAELKQTFGENISLAEGVVLNDQTTIFVASSKNPCADPGIEQCGLAAAKASKEARDAANDCCCTVFYGWICCDRNGVLIVDALMEPNNGCK